MDKAGTAFIIHFTQQIIRVLFLSDLLHRSFCIRRSEDSDRQLFFIQAAVRSGIFHPKRLNESYRTGGIGCIRKIL